MTVEEVLRESGFTDEQIRAMEPKAITAFSGVLNEAQQARDAAELAQRSYTDFYESRIVPSLTAWDEERARIDNEMAASRAEAAFYRTQAEEAKKVGFISADAPSFQQPRDNSGRYVANAPGGTPGSPTFTGGGANAESIDQRLGTGLSNIGWAMQTYQRLNEGAFLPDSFDKLAEEAATQRMPFRDYVSRKYDFAGREAALAKAQQEQHDQKIRADAVAANDRKWAERVGSNPDIRRPVESRFADAAKAQRAGLRPDPLAMNETDRRKATTQAIRRDLTEGDGAA
jgi:hypothetical protein